MVGNKFDGAKDIGSLLQLMGVEDETPEANAVQDASEALRRYTAREIERVYTNASKTIGKELEYSSARHLVTGLFGLLTDGICTLDGPIRDFTQSPMIKELIEEEVGEGKDLFDYLAFAQGKGKSDEEREKAVADFDKNSESIRRFGSYSKNLANYCEETGKSPDAVLRSTKDRMAIVKRTYGSVAEYERIKVGMIKVLSKGVGQLEQLENIPLNMLIPALITSKTSVSDLSEISVNPNVLGNIAQSYLRDAAKFSKVFLIEYAKHIANEIAKLKELATEEQVD